MRIAVVGSGAMGALFGAHLTEAGHAVTLVDTWSEHVAAMNEGLRVDTPDGAGRTVDVSATTDHADVAGADLVVVFTKAFDTADAMDRTEPHLDGADVLTVQNGFRNAETVAEFVPEERVVAGVTEASSDLEGPGHITHTGTGTTTFGRPFAPNDPFVREVADALADAGIATRVTDEPRDAVWRKALVILAFNASSALTGRTVGGIWDGGRDLVERVVRETERVASCEGRDLGADPLGHVERVAEESRAHHTSMLQDVEAGRRTEIDHLNGELVRRADDHGVAVPVNETLAALVGLREGA